MINLAIAWPAVTAAFAASLVEVVEAFTVILAVGTVQGWRPALIGTVAGLAVLFGLVAVFGSLFSLVPIHDLQLVIGILLLLFGLRWLRKSVLRAAGVIPLHDELAIFERESAHLEDVARRTEARSDWIAGLTAFKAIILEGVEVAFVVIGVGAGGGMLWPASIGALAACILVLMIGAIVHRPLSRLPENTLKFGVGVVLTAFGVYWTGEGLGISWPGHDLAIVALAAIILLGASASTRYLRRGRAS